MPELSVISLLFDVLIESRLLSVEECAALHNSLQSLMMDLTATVRLSLGQF